MTPTTRPPVRRPIHDGPGDPGDLAARALTVALFLTCMIGVLFAAAGDYAITYACLTIAIVAIAVAAAHRRAVKP